MLRCRTKFSFLWPKKRRWSALSSSTRWRDAGFEVMEAERAAAALDTVNLHADRIHVLFTDIRRDRPERGGQAALRNGRRAQRSATA
jgi:hypothetical protein